MPDDPHMSLARELYGVWRETGGLKTPWHDLRPDDVKRFRAMASKALSWMEDFLDDEPLDRGQAW